MKRVLLLFLILLLGAFQLSSVQAQQVTKAVRDSVETIRIDTDITVCFDMLPYTWGEHVIGLASGSVTVTDSIDEATTSLVISDNITSQDTIYPDSESTEDTIIIRHDTISTLHLIINHSTEKVETVMLCYREFPYLWRGDTITLDQARQQSYYTDTVYSTDPTLCDSVYKLHIEVSDLTLVKRWDDVLVVYSKSMGDLSGYNIVWYRNSVPVHVGDQQFYYAAGGLDGNYHVEATLGSSKITSCPLTVERSTKGKLAVSPNPTYSTAVISNGEWSTGEEVLVYDMYGHLVMKSLTESEGTCTISLPDVKAGTYFVRIGSQTTKVIKQY